MRLESLGTQEQAIVIVDGKPLSKSAGDKDNQSHYYPYAGWVDWRAEEGGMLKGLHTNSCHPCATKKFQGTVSPQAPKPARIAARLVFWTNFSVHLTKKHRRNTPRLRGFAVSPRGVEGQSSWLKAFRNDFELISRIV